MPQFKDCVKQINKAWKTDVLTTGNFIKAVTKLSMGDLGFDGPVGGGLPEGHLSVFSGPESSGKTLAACCAMARYQRKYPEKMNVYVDAENSLLVNGDFLCAESGLDPHAGNFYRYDCEGKCAEDIFKDVLEMQACDDIGMIVIDSAPALISKADLTEDFDKDNGQRASIAKVLGKFIKIMMMYLPRRGNILLFINQVRIEGKTFTGATIYNEPCGYALNYYPSFKLRFGKRTFTLDDKTDIAASKAEGTDGFRINFSITKSRVGSIAKGGGFMTFRNDTGLDVVHDLLEVAMKYEYIQRPNQSSYILYDWDNNRPYVDPETGEELKIVGKQKVYDYMYGHKEFLDEYVEMITRHVSDTGTKINLLDDATLNEILEQEAAVNASFENMTAEEKAEALGEDVE